MIDPNDNWYQLIKGIAALPRHADVPGEDYITRGGAMAVALNFLHALPLELPDVGRWEEAWRAHQRKLNERGWNEPCVPGCTRDILIYYASSRGLGPWM